MLRFEKMTVKAQEAVQSAQEAAAQHENQQIEPIHLLAALVAQADGVVPPLLARLGIRTEALTQEIERELGRLPKVQGFAQQHMGRSLNDVLEQAFKEADSFKDEFVSTEHLFLAIAKRDRDPAGQLLKRQGASHEAILQALAGVRGNQRVTSQNPEATYASLEKYARDHPQSPKAPEALYKAAWRQAALVEIYKTEGEADRSAHAKSKALDLAARIPAQFPQSDWATRALTLTYMLQQNIPTYGSGRE